MISAEIVVHTKIMFQAMGNAILGGVRLGFIRVVSYHSIPAPVSMLPPTATAIAINGIRM